MRRVLAVVLCALLIMIATAVSGQGRIDPNGRPTAYDPEGQQSLWIWFDGDVWRVRATTQKTRHVFNGWVQFQRGLLALGKDDIEGNVDIVSRFGDRVGFHLVAAGDVDGFNLRTARGTPVTFYVEIDGRTGGKALEKIFVGRRNRNPSGNPFTLYP
ncbi:MAG TPA: hypothetical protein VGR24_01095 [bacterium]|nr:hypothetical protein [bacterium]